MQQDRATLAAPAGVPAPATRNPPGRSPTRTDRATKPPAAEPAAKPAPPPPLSADQLAIRRVLDAYRAAYTSGDIKALQSVQDLTPAMQKSIAADFASTRYLVQIDREDIRVSPDGRRAVVDAAVQRRAVNAGVRTFGGVERFTLEKRRGRWVIVSVGPPS